MKKEAFFCAAVFSSHMVLQREKAVEIFGAGRAGSRVTVTIDGCRAQSAVKESRWCVKLPPHSAGGPYTMAVTDGTDTFTFTDVLFGEVWLAGGQSNMEFELQNCKGGRAELTACQNDQLRFYNVGKCANQNEELLESERKNCWRVSSEKACADVSAVAYFCAKKLQKELQVPVGIIDCYWGGTSISCWMPKEQLMRSLAGRRYIDVFQEQVGSTTDEEFERDMQAFQIKIDAWNDRVKQCRAVDPDISWAALSERCGACPWPPPIGWPSPYRPAGLYETMLQRVMPYTIRGFLYYQGEQDEDYCKDYGEMMLYLIAQWRADWHDEALPFLFVQLPMYAAKEEYDKGLDNGRWCILRQKQQWVCRFVCGTAMAVALDCGELDNMHPTNKEPVGCRLALQALQKVYGFPVKADGPVCTGCRPEGHSLRAFFAHTGGFLQLKGPCGSAFETAGEDGRFFAAQAQVQGQTLLLTAAKVPMPCQVRYAWKNFAQTPLYGAENLPAAPFCR
ncbi:MAG: sialate O-acetylesterase [Oscillospiraceae bacterium]|jgi:sialate O-acetylesterase|nr:sialate O-acetylesterase [Oscillospiraceae bacterium]